MYGRASDGTLQKYTDGLHPVEQEIVEMHGWVNNGDGTISPNSNPGTPKSNLDDNTAGWGEIVGYHPYPDTDGDGLTDDIDDFPNDPDEQEDQDGDGIGDNSDPYPLNEDVTDTDGDGVYDAFDLDKDDANNAIDISIDTDNDGTPDYEDDYPNNEDVNDSDNDGVVDSEDAFPN